jgi:predicted PhzF superfamily epimerase YddE/YHI9
MFPVLERSSLDGCSVFRGPRLTSGRCFCSARHQGDAQIARPDNLARPPFTIIESANRFGGRWFTPSVEVDLCCYATLGRLRPLAKTLRHSGVLLTEMAVSLN